MIRLSMRPQRLILSFYTYGWVRSLLQSFFRRAPAYKQRHLLLVRRYANSANLFEASQATPSRIMNLGFQQVGRSFISRSLGGQAFLPLCPVYSCLIGSRRKKVGAGVPSPTTLYSYGNGNRGERLTYALFQCLQSFQKLFADGAVQFERKTFRFIMLVNLYHFS